VTWSNQPGTAGPAAATTSGPGWRAWAVVAQVQAMYDGANHGFLIRYATASGGSQQRLNSRERRTNRPHFVVSFTPVD
jgi:hypothetical protein